MQSRVLVTLNLQSHLMQLWATVRVRSKTTRVALV